VMRKYYLSLREIFYRTMVRPTILYGIKCCLVKNQHKHKVSITKMRMLCWMCGETIYDRIINYDIRES